MVTFLEDAGPVHLDDARVVLIFLVEAHVDRWSAGSAIGAACMLCGGEGRGGCGKFVVVVGVAVVVRSCSNAGTAAVPSTLLRTNVHWARMWRGLARVSLNQSDKIS